MELALPITVYWDIAPEAPFTSLLHRLCDEILVCRPLMLQLYDPSGSLSEAAVTILERFKGEQISVSLTLSNSSLRSLLENSNALPVCKELLIACDSLESLTEFPSSPEVGLSFFVTRKNWMDLATIVSFCKKRKIKRLVLPMQRLYSGGEEPFFLSKSEQKELERELATVGGVGGDIRLTIHDPFLWRAFNPDIPFPQGGCQAANTMISISPDWGVYPCPTLPERLGVIGDKTLKEIVTSPLKREIRRRILETPSACTACHDLQVCKGGCRGRSLVIHTSYDEVDDACR